MKSVFIITILILGLLVTYSSAQMGHGMMRNTHEMGQDHTTEQKEMMGKGHMMEHDKMISDMMNTTHRMSEIIHYMSEMMGDMSKMSRDMSRDRMHKMSNMMRDMCAEINKMSLMMDKGMATDEEMRTIHNRMIEMQKQMWKLRK